VKRRKEKRCEGGGVGGLVEEMGREEKIRVGKGERSERGSVMLEGREEERRR